MKALKRFWDWLLCNDPPRKYTEAEISRKRTILSRAVRNGDTETERRLRRELAER